jgi:PTS system fructose-specific IIC component
VNVNSQKDLFTLIAEKGIELNRVKPKKTMKIVEAFLKREAEGSTGFEDGFAIPHAQSKYILEPTIFVIRLHHKIE